MADPLPILDNQLYLSRDEIRNQLISQVQQYLELVDVDLTKSSFITYIIDVLSTLTSNMVFYQMSVYREFFLTKAQLPESVLNLAAFIGYAPLEAKHSTCNITISFPFTFQYPNVEITIPEGATFKTADGISFSTIFQTLIVFTDNETVTATAISDNSTTPLVTYISSAYETASIMLPVVQKQDATYEFQIPQDLPLYRFTEYMVRFDGQLSDIKVEVKDPGSEEWREYIRYSSLYIMSPTDYGYVARPSDEGYTLYFGNGLIGVQPPIGGTIRVTVSSTLGARGNIISNTIVSGDRLNFVNPTGQVENINYKVYNPSPAIGGCDSQTLEEIKFDAINNLTSLHRFVSKEDYQKAKSIKPDILLVENSYPILKRSDIKNNEIMLFITLMYNNVIVPTRNYYMELPNASSYGSEIIEVPRQTIVEYDGEEYLTLFDLYIDKLNEISKYKYVTSRLMVVPTMVKSINRVVQIEILNCEIFVHAPDSDPTSPINTVTFKMQFNCSEAIPPEEINANFIIEKNMVDYNMNIVINGEDTFFEITFNPYITIPEGEQRYFIELSHPLITEGVFAQYQINVMVRKDLDSVMLSNTFLDEENDTLVISDVPVVLRSYYDALDSQEDFEYYVLQRLLTSMDISDKRMMTDFTNIKFPNTYGMMTNMLHNRQTKFEARSMYLTEFPPMVEINHGYRYILSGLEDSQFANKRHWIAQFFQTSVVLLNPNTGLEEEFVGSNLTEEQQTWDIVSRDGYFTAYEPQMDDIIYVIDQNKKYIFSSCGWVIPTFKIPLKIEINIEKESNTSNSIVAIINNIKKALIENIKPSFGNECEILRSKITSTVQGINGVNHCKLVEPSFNIFYDFELRDLTEIELMKYTPEYIYFNEDDIEVIII